MHVNNFELSLFNNDMGLIFFLINECLLVNRIVLNKGGFVWGFVYGNWTYYVILPFRYLNFVSSLSCLTLKTHFLHHGTERNWLGKKSKDVDKKCWALVFGMGSNNTKYLENHSQFLILFQWLLMTSSTGARIFHYQNLVYMSLSCLFRVTLILTVSIAIQIAAQKFSAIIFK